MYKQTMNKKLNNQLFDVTIAMCDLVSALILSQLFNIIKNTYMVQYRNDGLIIKGNTNRPKLDR